MKYGLVLSLATATAILLGGCGYDNDGKNIVGKSQLISATELFNVSPQDMQPFVNQIKPNSPAFGIKGYRVVYKTHDDKGNEVNASGLVTIPVPSQIILNGLKKEGKSYTMSIVSNQHGTIFPDSEAPTTSVITTHKPTSISTLFSALGGFVTVEPDYIGYGQSKNLPHPYLLEKSSANSVIDLIEATIKLGNDNSLPLNGQVFLTGYSEGGYVTMAAADEIENHHKNIHLMGVAPMSGPYDLNLTGMGVLSATQMGRPDFIGGIVYSYANYMGMNLNEVINDQYASNMPTLYNKETNSSQIQSELTQNINDFFVPTFRGDFLTNPKNPLREAFVENSVDDYKPTSSTRLFYCSGDKTIDPRIALKASQALGVEAIDLDPNKHLGHAECAIPAYGAALSWFDKLRKGEK